jgi:hypothetical protein
MNKNIHVDLAGAYNSVPLKQLYETLLAYGFPSHLVSCIKSMYTDNTVRIHQGTESKRRISVHTHKQTDQRPPQEEHADQVVCRTLDP